MTTSTSVERRRLRVRLALALSTVLCSGLAAPAFAQTSQPYRNLDANGVDLTQGDLVLAFREGAIGSGQAMLALDRQNNGLRPFQWDAISFKRTIAGSTVTITIGLPNRTIDTFTATGTLSTSFAPNKKNGATLTLSSTDPSYVYVYQSPDGTTITFNDPGDHDSGQSSNFCYTRTQSSCDMLATQVVSPDGASVAIAYDLLTFGSDPDPTFDWRVASVTNSFGYALGFTYQDNGTTGGGDNTPWFTRTQSKLFNASLSTTTPQSTVSYSYPSAGVTDVTDMAGNVWEVTATSIKRPGESSPSFSASSATAVTSVTKDGVTTGYSRSVSGGTATMTVTDALSHSTTVVSNLSVGRSTSVTDALGYAISYTYDSYGRLTRTTQPEGNYVNYTYDTRGNVTETRIVAKSGRASRTSSARQATRRPVPISSSAISRPARPTR